MKNIGIICEYNPFHRGHEKQLDFVHAQGGGAVCLMSGNYVQRGEPALFDKLTRAEAAVRCGADLVLELPLTAAISSAEGFAAGAVEVLDRLGCVEALCFGTETGTADTLMETARRLDSPETAAALKTHLAAGLSFPAARAKALNSDLLTRPNDILAVEYCKALLRRGSDLQPLPLRRPGSYHHSLDPENPSASALRGMEDWRAYVPPAALDCFAGATRHSLKFGERAVLARLRSFQDFEHLPFGTEGLWSKFQKACRRENGIDAVIDATKSKRYTRTRIQRMLLCAVLGITELNIPLPYVRVLAMNDTGGKILRQARKTSAIPIVNAGQCPPDREYYAMECRCADLYGLFAETVEAGGREQALRVKKV